MKQNMWISTIFLIIFSIIFLICGDTLTYNRDLEHTAEALRKIDQMYRRVRRRAAPMRGQQQKPSIFGRISVAVKNSYRRVKALMNPRFYQGDILLVQRQSQSLLQQIRSGIFKNKRIRVPSFGFGNANRTKRRVKADIAFKWNGPIPFYVDRGVPDTLIVKSLLEIQKETCLRFQQVRSAGTQSSGLRYFLGQGCSSYVGKVYDDKFQDVSIGSDCFEIGLVQHETMHALGCFHEQSRLDRDRYVEIIQQNIPQDKMRNFLIIDVDDGVDYNLPYDYVSIMHYSLSLFSKNGQPTTVPKLKDYMKSMGVGDRVSFLDYKFLNLHYCSQVCPRPIQCSNWGYQDPNSCTRCKCPSGFDGQYCEKVASMPGNCGQPAYKAGPQIQEINVSGFKNCYFVVTAQPGQRIAYKLVFSYISPGYVEYCTIQNCMEFKFFKDKSVSGARYCLKDMETVRISDNHFLMITYNSNGTNNKATVLYKAINF
uniref:Zinc metalloproteinase n=1 Tax=Strongyloides papillosus TaxID=174720 RepID=A0A0N5BH84_STREA